MPKGDRLKLKADPEDGTTPVANLLLEAVAMSKISGLQKGAIIFLWRKTYGWVGKDGKRLKEAKITLGEWCKALDRDKSRISKALIALESMNLIHRRVVDMWSGYYYSLNTDISSWNSDSINIAKLKEIVVVAQLPIVDENATVDEKATVDENATVGEKGNSGQKQHATVGENATLQLAKTPLTTLYKETLNKGKEIKDDKILSSPIGEKVKEVFGELDKIRGYRPPKRKAEAASIIRMLKKYSPSQIIETYRVLKEDKFWQGKELFMMSVESQIGAILKDGAHQSKPGKTPTKYTRPEELLH